MSETVKKISSQEILKSNMANTKSQIKSFDKSVAPLSSPQLAKRLRSVGSANDVDKIALSNIRNLSESKGIVTELKCLIKGFL